jgi:nucleotide-binding universal stress UspA family protein
MKRILVALDRTAASRTVLAGAVELARETGGKLRLMRAVDSEPGGPVVAAAKTALDGLERTVPPELRDGIVVERGNAANAIRSAAAAYQADMIVVGAHRFRMLRRATATTLMRDGEQPIFIVRAGAKGPRVTRADAERPFRGHDRHSLLEAATLAGTASGAVAGAIAGPPGAVAGGLIGTAVGMLAGQALDKSDARATARDRVLDEQIGVTRGELGIEAGMLRPAATMRREHARLEEIYAALLAAYREGDWADVRTQWGIFEPALRAHLDMEERDILPAFRAVDADEADAIALEHIELRRLLDTLGVLVELHAVPERDVEALLERLAAHGAREEFLLYPWLDEEKVDERVGQSDAETHAPSSA